jgi:acyl carrier protein
MSILTTEQRVKIIIADQMFVDVDVLTPSTDFAEDLDGDSLDQVEMVMKMEEEFNIEIQDDDADTLTTVGAVVEYVGKRV